MFRRSKIPKITPESLLNWFKENKKLVIIDVRTPNEWFQTGIIPGSVMVPNYEIERQLQNGLKLNQGTPIIVVCRSGHRSARVAKFLISKGYDAYNLAGGIMNWYGSGYGLERV